MFTTNKKIPAATETTETIPELMIRYSPNPGSPRDWDNLATFITSSRKYYSIDSNHDLERILRETAKEAKNLEDHQQKFCQGVAEELKAKIAFISPISKYEHSGVCYSLGATSGWDSGVVGFCFVTKERLKSLKILKKDIQKTVAEELSRYNTYINGLMYDFMLLNEEGEEKDSGVEFFSLEEIRAELPSKYAKEGLVQYVTEY
jgi:hypothetical protein